LRDRQSIVREEGRLTVMWFGQRKGEGRPLLAVSSRLIADTEAFLSGDYADHLRRCCDVVPGWARLNSFAHGDLERLRQVERPFAAPRSAAVAEWIEETWRSAQRVLASELLELVDNDPEMLSRVQHTVLVPLELQLMHTEAESGLTAFELVQATRAALRSTIS
jgi:hypothetical protein